MRIFTFALLLLHAGSIFAQQRDTIQLLNFFGTNVAAINNDIKNYRQLKPLMKAYPETFEAWKKARNAERVAQFLIILDVASTFTLLLSENEAFILSSLGVGVGALVTGILYTDIRNRRLKNAVELYNQKVRESASVVLPKEINFR
jgi:hypothetical protein